MSTPAVRILDDLLKFMVVREAREIVLATAQTPKVTTQEGLSVNLSPTLLQPEHMAALVDAVLATWTEGAEFDLRRPEIGVFRVCLTRSEADIRVALRPLRVPPTIDGFDQSQAVGDLALRERGLVLLSSRIGHALSPELAALVLHRVTHTPDHVLLVSAPDRYHFMERSGGVTWCDPCDEWRWQQRLADVQTVPVQVLALAAARTHQDVVAALDFAERGLSLVMVDGDDVTAGLERLLHLFPAEQRPVQLLRLADRLSAALAFRAVPRQRVVSGPDAPCVLAVELLRADGAVAELLRQDRLESLRDILQEHPQMQTLEQCLFSLWAGCLIDTQDALRAANRREDLHRLMEESPRRTWIG